VSCREVSEDTPIDHLAFAGCLFGHLLRLSRLKTFQHRANSFEDLKSIYFFSNDFSKEKEETVAESTIEKLMKELDVA